MITDNVTSPQSTGANDHAERLMPLHQRFALAGSVVMLAGMALIGAWVSSRIEDAVTRNSAISTALYMESFIAPLSQDLTINDELPAEVEDRLRETFSRPPLSERILSVKLWKQGGLIAFATDADLIGRQFEPPEDLLAAWRGQLSAAFDDLHDEEDARERMSGVPLLEVYNPIHSMHTGEIIAVAEFYEDASGLKNDLFDARLQSWLIVGGVTLAMFALLFGIVRGGSRTIERQHRELSQRLTEVSLISRQNNDLRRRIQGASLRSTELNEVYLKRISAELHDGPAQALALVSLRLDSLLKDAAAPSQTGEEVVIRQSLDEALKDIRNICRGLTLPEIAGLTVAETISMAVEAHERRTNSSVQLNSGDVSFKAHHPTLICIYRFVQEGLMNGFRHGQGSGQSVACRIEGNVLRLEVCDTGPGFALDGKPGLGLSGLRERVESIGGEYEADTAPGGGARLVMRVVLNGDT